MPATSALSMRNSNGEEIWFARLFALMGAAPLLSYGALLLFAGYATAATGHWPAYNMPDPKTLSLNGTSVVFLAILGSAMATPVFVATTLVRVLWRVWRQGWARPNALISQSEMVGLVACVSGLLAWGFASRRLLIWLCD